MERVIYRGSDKPNASVGKMTSGSEYPAGSWGLGGEPVTVPCWAADPRETPSVVL